MMIDGRGVALILASAALVIYIFASIVGDVRGQFTGETDIQVEEVVG